MTAAGGDERDYVRAIHDAATDDQRQAYERYFPGRVGELGVGEHFIGTRMGTIFELAKAQTELSLEGYERMLDSGVHEVRVGALKAMALAASSKRTTDARREQLAALYLRRHDRVNDWDLVDLAAGPVVGGWLRGRPEALAVLEELASDADPWRRRTAIVACAPWLRAKEKEPFLTLATRLVDDPHELVQKAVGWYLRWLGDVDARALTVFLEQHAATMPRPALRAAIEKLPPHERKEWLAR